MKNSCNIVRIVLFVLFCALMARPAAGRGRTVFDKNTGFKITQNKLDAGRRNLHAEIDFKLLNYANASATATLRVEDV
ncbi:MAG: hypothetical protein K2L73_06350, partial [Muribaculaceae bacterium]|nr:hypothetical protein [Muribaculaceae bacterium]